MEQRAAADVDNLSGSRGATAPAQGVDLAVSPTQPTQRYDDAGSEDTELDEPVPNAERLVAQAVTLAGDDHDAATLVARYWRFAPDEELVGRHRRGDARRPRPRAPGAGRAAAVRRAEAAHHPGRRGGRAHRRSRSSPTTCRSWSTRSPRRCPPANLDVHLLVHPLVVVRREPLGALRRGPPGRGAGRRDRRATWSRAGCASRSTGSAMSRCSRTSRRELRGCSPTCARRSRTGRRCACRRSRWPTSWPRGPAAGAGEGHHRLGGAAALAGRRPLHLPRLPGVPARRGAEGEKVLDAVLGTGLGILRSDRTAAPGAVLDDARGVREGAGEAPADHHEGQLAGHRAPLGVPRLHRLQDLRRRRQGRRRAAVPRPVLRRGLPHQRARAAGGPAQGHRGAAALRAVPAQPLRQGPDARSWRPTRATSCSRSAPTSCTAR